MTPAMVRPEQYVGRRYWVGVGKLLAYLAVALLISLGLWALIIWGVTVLVGALAGMFR